MPDTPPVVHTIAEIADALDCSRDLVENLIKSGRLAYVPLGPRRKVVTHAAFLRFLEENETAA